MTEDWTDDRGKWINFNSGFIERILHKRCIGVEIAVVVTRLCSLCWMLKVRVEESLRLSASTWCRYKVFLYGQVVDVAGVGQ